MRYVDYIQNGVEDGSRSNGWELDLGYTPTTATTIQFGINCPTNYGAIEPAGVFFGSFTRYANNYVRVFYHQPNKITYDNPKDNNKRVYVNCTFGQDANFEIGLAPNGYIKNLDTGVVTAGSTSTDCNYNITLKCWSDIDNHTQGLKFYYIKIYENNVLVKEYLPALNDQNRTGLYETVGGQFYTNSGDKVYLYGRVLTSIVATPSKSKFAAEGESISINVDCDNAWTVSCSANWLTLSSTGATGDATITATADSYSGQTNRDALLTFTDTVTSDEYEVTLTQKKYSVGQPLHLGAAEITDIYLGNGAINAAYLGDVQVYSSGPFTGLKARPSTVNLDEQNSSSTITVKSSEAWTITTPEWLTASVTGGTSGTSDVVVTIGQMSATTTGSVVFNSANFSASVQVNYYEYTPMQYVYEDGLTAFNNSHRINTNVLHTSTAMTIQVEFYGYWNGSWDFSNRIVGYSPEDPECNGDDYDWRLFGYNKGAYDYGDLRVFVPSYVEGYHNLTLGDYYILNNETGTYLTGTTVGSVPTPNCPIFVDLSYTKIKSVKIKDGNTVLFDGKAALYNGSYGLFDLVSGALFTNSDITVVGE